MKRHFNWCIQKYYRRLSISLIYPEVFHKKRKIITVSHAYDNYKPSFPKTPKRTISKRVYEFVDKNKDAGCNKEKKKNFYRFWKICYILTHICICVTLYLYLYKNKILYEKQLWFQPASSAEYRRSQKPYKHLS